MHSNLQRYVWGLFVPIKHKYKNLEYKNVNVKLLYVWRFMKFVVQLTETCKSTLGYTSLTDITELCC